MTSEATRRGLTPDRRRALEFYGDVADDYDLMTSAGDPYRRRAVEALALCPGDAVLDVGCGTGLNLPLLGEAVGPDGRLVGIEQCPEMLAGADERAPEAPGAPPRGGGARARVDRGNARGGAGRGRRPAAARRRRAAVRDARHPAL